MGSHEDREKMVEQQLVGRGIRDELVLNAMRRVPRESFVSENLQQLAYHDSPLPIADGQTISQPYIVAFMIEALRLSGGERVLEIGAGSGYAAAVLAEIASEVYAVERIEALVHLARSNLKSANVSNVRVRHGDGTLGWPEFAPYDAILVSAGGPIVPESLKSQLRIGGRMVIPIASVSESQNLKCVLREKEDSFKAEDIGAVRFVPLIGDEGWKGE